MAVRRARHEFWGSGPAYRAVGDFTFHRLAATAPEHEVERHTHDEAHFVLILSGGYKSSAVGAPPVSQTPLLLFNPAGTTHEDRFLGGQGSFLAISGGREKGLGPATRLYDPYAIWVAHRIAAQFDREDVSALDFDARAHQLLAGVVPLTSDESRTAAQPPRWLKRAFEMSFTADAPDLTVADLAAEVGVHPVHLARVFKRYLRCSPGRASARASARTCRGDDRRFDRVAVGHRLCRGLRRPGTSQQRLPRRFPDHARRMAPRCCADTRRRERQDAKPLNRQS